MEKGKKKEKDERAAHTEYIQRVLRGLVVGESLGVLRVITQSSPYSIFYSVLLRLGEYLGSVVGFQFCY